MQNNNEREHAHVLVDNNNETTPLISNQQRNHNNHNKKREMTGLLYMTLSALGFSTMSLFVKLSGSRFPSFEIVLSRSVIQTLFGLFSCALLKINPLGKREVRSWLCLRGLAGTIGLSLFYFSITQLPLADATGI